ncbi:hypothetical protein KJ644_04465 [Candidatus Dependentiae bacterium]|nr:hypothetical protein [Candidatus Dependentiae bacterium]MBU4387693.1 hypothetical protein [Candidatus Dependentiae bacterium]MCG2756603.1 hypothetical protein [Candidatus Dependentiae bacterium]
MSIEDLSLLSIIFNFTIFFLLILVIYNLFKNYGAPYLYSEIENKKKHEQDLKNKDLLLIKTKDNLENEIYKQQEKISFLKNKVENWKNNLLEKKIEKEFDHSKYLNELKNKRNLQLNNFKIAELQKIAIPEAVKKAYDEMLNVYGGTTGLNLTRELINKIKP